MQKWEKPVLSILGVSSTKGSPVFEDLNNLPVVEINTEDTVSIGSYRSGCEKVGRGGSHGSSGRGRGRGRGSSSSSSS